MGQHNLLYFLLRHLLLLSVCVSLVSGPVKAQFVYQADPAGITIINNHVFFYQDESGNAPLSWIARHAPFTPANSNSNFGLTNAALWFRIPVKNASSHDSLTIGIANGLMDTAELFAVRHGIQYSMPNVSKAYYSVHPLFKIALPPQTLDTYYLRIRSNKPLSVPIFAGSELATSNNVSYNLWLFGGYLGIVIIMFFYNLFIYFTTRDKDYQDYVIYLFFLAFTQICLQGYMQYLIGADFPQLSRIMVPLSTTLVGISSSLFIKRFLNLNATMPWVNKAINGFMVVYLITIVMICGGWLIAAQNIIQANTVIGIFLALFAGVRVQRRGFRPAVFFNISWSVFLLSVVVWILKDIALLPFNALTNNSILIGSSWSILFLSFALADKINIYKKEKEDSQALALSVSQENERIVREQNVILEQRVNERTLALAEANNQLTDALQNLKEAETQMLENEKMASLGQLTAGIAHEINNPINFVTANISPLSRDITVLLELLQQFEAIALESTIPAEKAVKFERLKQDVEYDYLKEEIGHLMNGIAEGAHRTADIVKGLRIFSRLDEDALKLADINEGITSTLVIINNLLENRVNVQVNFAHMPPVECYPGKLNQVFLNILSNAVYAINKRWGTNTGGTIDIQTACNEHSAEIVISDNGTGMDEETRKRLFEPFFTTKEVGEGTGLGMSIAYNIIRKHNGTIRVASTPNQGTIFTISIPIRQ